MGKSENSMKEEKSKVDKAAKGEKAAKAGKSAKAGVEESKRPNGKGGGKGGEGKAVKSSHKSKTPKAPKGKKGGSGSQSPCPVSVVLKDINAKKKLRDSDKEAIKCFDTSQVTTMEYPFMKKFVNADISSWDVSSVTAMNRMFYEATEFNGDVSDWDV